MPRKRKEILFEGTEKLKEKLNEIKSGGKVNVIVTQDEVNKYIPKFSYDRNLKINFVVRSR